MQAGFCKFFGFLGVETTEKDPLFDGLALLYTFAEKEENIGGLGVAVPVQGGRSSVIQLGLFVTVCPISRIKNRVSTFLMPAMDSSCLLRKEKWYHTSRSEQKRVQNPAFQIV